VSGKLSCGGGEPQWRPAALLNGPLTSDLGTRTLWLTFWLQPLASSGALDTSSDFSSATPHQVPAGAESPVSLES
jgi:hypothetical protein